MPFNYPKSTSPEGYESYNAFQVLYPVHINVRRFSTLDKPFPQDMWFAKVADEVKEKTRTNADIHLASRGWHGVNALDGTGKGKIMVICGSGRSIVKTAPLIPKWDDDLIVVAINGALKAMPPGSVDIYFTLDWLSNREWWSGMDVEAMHPGIKGVLGLPTPGELASMFSERYYFPANYFAAEPEKSAAFSAQHGFLAECELATHSAMHLAYRMGCSAVVLLGHDFACTDLWYHWDEKLEKKHSLNVEFKMCLDMNDKATCVNDNLVKNSHIVACTAQMMAEEGIEVWNSTEEGILAIEKCAPLDQALNEIRNRAQVEVACV